MASLCACVSVCIDADTGWRGGSGPHTDCRDVFTGGLDTVADADGAYAYYWKDDVTQIVFHVATLMPGGSGGPDDLAWVNRKRHIGNDYVTIVYNDASHEFVFGASFWSHTHKAAACAAARSGGGVHVTLSVILGCVCGLCAWGEGGAVARLRRDGLGA
jgi:hypothetical protein